MIRLVGVNLPKNKRIAYGLTYIHGVGLTLAKKFIEVAKIDPETQISELTTEETVILCQTLEESDLKLKGDLRWCNGLNIKRLNKINSHRGKRQQNNLPVRGQRTRTNAHTGYGAKNTVTGKKKEFYINSKFLYGTTKDKVNI